MPVRHLCLGLLVNEPQLSFFEWMRKELMGPEDVSFPHFVSGLGMEGNVLHIPLLDFELVDACWALDSIIADLVRDTKGRVRPVIMMRLPELRVRFEKGKVSPSADVFIKTSGTLELASYFAQGIVGANYPDGCKVSFAHPEIKVGVRSMLMQSEDHPLPPTQGMETCSTGAILLDTTKGHSRYQPLSIYSFVD